MRTWIYKLNTYVIVPTGVYLKIGNGPRENNKDAGNILFWQLSLWVTFIVP